jgi:chromosome segregation ATPase
VSEQDWETVLEGLEVNAHEAAQAIGRLRQEMEELRALLRNDAPTLADVLDRNASLESEIEELRAENARLKAEITDGFTPVPSVRDLKLCQSEIARLREALEKIDAVPVAIPYEGSTTDYEGACFHMKAIARAAINNTGGEDQ